MLMVFIDLVVLFIAMAVDSFLPTVIIWILLNIFNMIGTLTFWSIWLVCGLIDFLILLITYIRSK